MVHFNQTTNKNREFDYEADYERGFAVYAHTDVTFVITVK